MAQRTRWPVSPLFNSDGRVDGSLLTVLRCLDESPLRELQPGQINAVLTQNRLRRLTQLGELRLVAGALKLPIRR